MGFELFKVSLAGVFKFNNRGEDRWKKSYHKMTKVGGVVYILFWTFHLRYDSANLIVNGFKISIWKCQHCKNIKNSPPPLSVLKDFVIILKASKCFLRARCVQVFLLSVIWFIKRRPNCILVTLVTVSASIRLSLTCWIVSVLLFLKHFFIKVSMFTKLWEGSRDIKWSFQISDFASEMTSI